MIEDNQLCRGCRPVNQCRHGNGHSQALSVGHFAGCLICVLEEAAPLLPWGSAALQSASLRLRLHQPTTTTQLKQKHATPLPLLLGDSHSKQLSAPHFASSN
jgi:hypothetical protein